MDIIPVSVIPSTVSAALWNSKIIVGLFRKLILFLATKKPIDYYHPVLL